MSKISYIVTAILIVLGGVFAVLYQVYNMNLFAYFMLAILAILALFWGVWLIVQYRTTYKKELEERFELYRAETINKMQITSEQFEQEKEAYGNEFKKSLKRERLMKWFFIAFAFACALLFILAAVMM